MNKRNRTGRKIITFDKKRLDPNGKGEERANPLDIECHMDEVLALAGSRNGQIQGRKKKLGVWDAEKNE